MKDLYETNLNGRSEQDINNARKAFKEKEDGKQNRQDDVNININNDTKHRNRTDVNKINNFQKE